MVIRMPRNRLLLVAAATSMVVALAAAGAVASLSGEDDLVPVLTDTAASGGTPSDLSVLIGDDLPHVDRLSLEAAPATADASGPWISISVAADPDEPLDRLAADFEARVALVRGFLAARDQGVTPVGFTIHDGIGNEAARLQARALQAGVGNTAVTDDPDQAATSVAAKYRLKVESLAWIAIGSSKVPRVRLSSAARGDGAVADGSYALGDLSRLFGGVDGQIVDADGRVVLAVEGVPPFGGASWKPDDLRASSGTGAASSAPAVK